MTSEYIMLEATVNRRDHLQSLSTAFEQQLISCKSYPAIVVIPIDIDAMTWLEAQPVGFKMAWGQRGERSMALGLGVACRVTARPGESATETIARCRTALRGHDELRCYGGFAFQGDASCKTSGWQSFGAASFWLPRATVNGSQLRIVVLDETDVAEARRFVSQLVPVSATRQPRPLPNWTRRIDLPNREEWTECIEKSMQLFNDEVLEKIVLARQVQFEFANSLSPLAFVRQLAPMTPACYHFCFQTSANEGFVGASPERLFWRAGEHLLSEVVAGTRPRGDTEDEDERLGRELLTSRKDQLEHDIVRKSIRQRLHACVQHLEVDAKASLLKLASKQHLFSQVKAKLLDHIRDGELIDRLHPTPAVGGYPTENALDEIRQLEPFERGWYAAPVGWIGVNDAEFAVAIRSGMVQSKRLTLYSGAGIVPGSTAASEWDEIEQKISDFLMLLRPAESAERAVTT